MSDVTADARRSSSLRSALSRHRGLAALVGLGTFVAVILAAHFLLPTTYTASTTVLVNPLPGNPLAPTQRGDQLTTLPTEAKLVTSDAVAQQLTSDGVSITPAQLRSKVSVENPPNTAVLKISYTGGTATGAAKGADATATAYLETRTARARTSSAATLATLQQNRASVSKQLQTAATELARTTSGSATYTVLVERVSGLSGQIAALDQQISDVTTSLGDAGVVLSPASVPTQPNGPSLPLLALVALVAGVLAGCAAAAWRERAAGVIRDVRDLRDFGVPVVSIVGGTSPVSGARPVRIDDRRSINELLPRVPDGTIQAIVTSVDSKMHALDATSSLAQLLGDDGHDVVVVDSTATGAGAVVGDSLVMGRWHDGHWVSSPGPLAGRDFTQGPDASEAVLVAGPSPLTADGVEVARDRDRSLLVVELGVTRRRDVGRAIEALKQLNDFGMQSTTLVSYHPARSTSARNPEGAASPQTGR